MGKTARRTWQVAEQAAAALFGARRKPGSGSGGRDDETASDSVHERLYIETKLRHRHTARSLHDETREAAKREGKVAVVVLRDKGRVGQLVCVHSDDLDLVVVERVRAVLGDGEADALAAKLTRPAAKVVEVAGRLREVIYKGPVET
jgi:hypothetical protein